MTTRPAERTSFDRLMLVGILIALSVSIGCGSQATDAQQTQEPDEATATDPSQLPPNHPPVAPAREDSVVPMPPPGSGSGQAGLSWEAPADWTAEPPQNAMRKAQYRIPGSGGDAECVVFYFGPGQGGSPQQNAERWAGQFAQPDGTSPLEAMTTEQIDVDGIPVLLVEVSGTYSGGRMQGPSLDLTDQMLLGAIAQGADANWFFKLTGPSPTVREQAEAFEKMIRSLRRGS